MPRLEPPHLRFHRSYLAAVAEQTAGPRPVGPLMAGVLDRHAGGWQESEGFARFVAEMRAWARGDQLPPEMPVPATVLWWTEGDTHLGTLFIRHRLTPQLLDFGGHIGAAVNAGARGRGHATAMLRAALPFAGRLGVDPALLTCDRSNTASRKVIEKCGGVLEDRRGNSLRYWIGTANATKTGGTGSAPGVEASSQS
ncbi:GNAT family N-acetyltransferase [Streptomyces sp. NA04227]|uniref:GNAT family N-acetyltransferase n=1 Tax=Streptomyces sp. NA04227 TaxID=2742136 RepID=UPI001592A046|nr:GNAT family N-acetyltransferase [Streptomyces sp. NA04227]QKW06449.1 GNAT family N-acetyltransferase [Streptomyces sp. NA04227]